MHLGIISTLNYSFTIRTIRIVGTEYHYSVFVFGPFSKPEYIRYSVFGPFSKPEHIRYSVFGQNLLFGPTLVYTLQTKSESVSYAFCCKLGSYPLFSTRKSANSSYSNLKYKIINAKYFTRKMRSAIPYHGADIITTQSMVQVETDTIVVFQAQIFLLEDNCLFCLTSLLHIVSLLCFMNF